MTVNVVLRAELRSINLLVPLHVFLCVGVRPRASGCVGLGREGGHGRARACAFSWVHIGGGGGLLEQQCNAVPLH